MRRGNDNEIPAKVPKWIADCSEPKIHNIIEEDDDIEIIEYPSTSSSVKHKTGDNNVIKAVATSTSNLTEQKIQNSNIIKKIVVDTRKQVNEKSNIEKETVVIPDIIDITDIDEISVHVNNNHEVVAPSKNNVKTESVEPNEKMMVDNDCDSAELNLNIKQELQNNVEQQHDPTITVKQEPDWGCFSQIDLVEINDDDDIFPFSQLFEKTNIKDEPSDTCNDEPHSSLFFDDGDDENVITILDSDNDDDDVYNVNSEINIQTRIKTEPGIDNICLTEIANEVFEFNEVQSTREDTNIVSNETTDFDSRSIPTSVNVTATSHQDSNNRSLSPLPKDPLPEPSTSKKSTQDKNERKGIKLIDAKPMKARKRTSKIDKKDEKSTKDKGSSKKHADKKKSSSKSDGKSSKEHPSKNKKHSNDKKNSSSSKNNDSNELNNTDDKNISDKNNESNKSENSRNESDKETRSKSNDNSDSSSLQNNSPPSDRPKYKTTKVNAKVSKKTRNDLFCDSICSELLRPKSRKELSKTTDEFAKKDATKTASKTASKLDNIPSFIIPRRQIPSSSTLGKSTSVPRQLNTLPSTSCDKEITSTVLTNTTNHIDFFDHIDPSSSSHNRQRTSLLSTESTTDNKSISSAVSQLKPLLTIPSIYNKNQKNVSFKENIADVREYQIDTGNQLKNIKCGLSMRSSRQDFTSMRSLNLKVEDFLARVFAWEPVWLEQQQKIKTLPPIVKSEDMQQLPNIFNNFEQYYRRIEVLLLLETWQLLLNEYECGGNKYVKYIDTLYKKEHKSVLFENKLVSTFVTKTFEKHSQIVDFDWSVKNRRENL